MRSMYLFAIVGSLLLLSCFLQIPQFVELIKSLGLLFLLVSSVLVISLIGCGGSGDDMTGGRRPKF